MRVLVIEDDATIAGFLRQGLSELGYVVDTGRDAREGDEHLAGATYDVIVLDVMLPGLSGVEFCRALRRRGVGTPILMLTALSSTGDKVSGLEAGADDYLVKPFEFDELAARVKALLRRGQAAEAAVLRYDDLEMDLVKRQVVRAGQKIRLTAKEFALLEYLVRHPERVLSRTQIGESVWDIDFEYGGNVIEVYISALRRKVDRGFARPLIHTVIGAGYVLNREAPNE